MLRQAAILVGGLGTRLNDRTRTTPKPLLSVGGRPFLDYILDEITRHGFTDILLLAGHLGQQVEALYHEKKWRDARIRVVIEPQPLGTGGALRFAAPHFEDRFLVANGDTFFDINLRAVASPSHFLPGGMAIALREDAEGTRFGRVSFSGGKVKSFYASEEKRTGPINGGIYCLSRDIISQIPEQKTSLESDILPGLAKNGLIRGQVFPGFFLDIGVPGDLERADYEMPKRTKRPAVFFDRDGVLNVDKGYVHKPADFAWMPGARDAIRFCNDNGYLVFVVTNQAGVAHGYYRERDVHKLHRWISEELARVDAHVDAFEFCPHHPQGKDAAYRHSCRRRKPNSGMIDDLLKHWPIDAQSSFLVGDQKRDIDAAEKAGIAGHLFDGENLLTLIRQKVGTRAL